MRFRRFIRVARDNPVPHATVAAMAAGAIAGVFNSDPIVRSVVWNVGLVLCGGPLVARTIGRLAHGQFAADVVATLAILASFLLGQPLVGLVIVLMQSGGEALERVAEGRATDALRELQNLAPSKVNRLREGAVEVVDANDVRVGEHVLVRPGEVIPCDGEVLSGRSHVDTSRITGEPVPAPVTAGSRVMSGTVNGEQALVVVVTAPASESQYARIVELVRKAQASKAPLQRVADRHAVWFTPVTIAVCAIAYGVSGEWNRVLAVLAVATPCPLILATPVAVLGGLNRAAKRNVLVRNGGALEALGAITAVVFDKTGTITIGRPKVSRVIAAGRFGEADVLRTAAAVEHYSGHLLARTLVEEAEARQLDILSAQGVVESPGAGAEGEVEGLPVLVGSRSFVVGRYPSLSSDVVQLDRKYPAALRAYVAVDGRLAGAVEYADRIRPGMPTLMTDLYAAGVKKIVLLSGDRSDSVAEVAGVVGIQMARGDLLPSDKVSAVQELMRNGESVLMIGDGTNDAPALSAATVGVALASQGRGIATEAANVILLVDDPARVVDVIHISRRAMRIARQSIRVGLGLSGIGMLAAAGGFLAPAAGAFLQEAIDLAVILNALRAAKSPPAVRETPSEVQPSPDRSLRAAALQFGSPRTSADTSQTLEVLR